MGLNPVLNPVLNRVREWGRDSRRGHRRQDPEPGRRRGWVAPGFIV